MHHLSATMHQIWFDKYLFSNCPAAHKLYKGLDFICAHRMECALLIYPCVFAIIVYNNWTLVDESLECVLNIPVKNMITVKKLLNQIEDV